MQDGDRRAAQIGRWAMAVMFAVNGMIMGAWAPQIPLLLPRHDISESTLGLLIFVLGVGAVGSMLYSGRLIAAAGSRRVSIGFGLMTAPMLPLVVLAPNLWLLALAMAVMGAVIGCMDVAMNANAVEVERRLSRAIMSSSHGFWSLGGFFGGIVGGLILARWGAEAQALIAGAVALCGVLAASPWLIAEAQTPKIANTPVPSQALFPRKPILWVLGMMALCSMVPEGAILDWAAIYLAKELGSDPARSGLAFGLFAGTMAVMRFAGDSVRNRFGAVLTLRVSGLIGAAGLMLAAVAPTDLIAVAGFAIAGIGVANMVPILFSAGGNQPGISAGTGIATVTMLGYCGILVAPSTIGFAAEAFGFRATYITLSLLLLGVASLAGYAGAADGARHAQAAKGTAT